LGGKNGNKKGFNVFIANDLRKKGEISELPTHNP
jgi:hypothetical protein